MTKVNPIWYLGLTVAAILLATVFMALVLPNVSFGQVPAGLSAAACTSPTSTIITVGGDVSTRVLATTSRRAYIRIQQPANATSTVYVALNGDVPAATSTGISLTQSTTTSPVPYVEFGLDTNNPYVGSVTVRSSSGSSTITLSGCVY